MPREILQKDLSSSQDEWNVAEALDGRRFQGCIDALTGLLELPFLWSGRAPDQVVSILLDAVLGILNLDFAYARFTASPGGSPFEALRVAEDQGKVGPAEVGRALDSTLGLEGPPSARKIPNPVGEGEASIVPLPLGPDRRAGLVVAGSERADFPTELESLLLRVAVNQAVIALQASQIAVAQRRAEESESLKDRLQAENVYLRCELDTELNSDIIGQSKAMKRVLRLVERVAPTTACVLIQGETGTGKELIAHAIHRLSDRKERRFIKLNCAAIPTGLLESELFGHEKGAFTGAISQRIGRFELANGGTILLDEVGEIPLELQAKLLRVLQDQEFERLGSTRTVHVDVRLVAASNRDLAQMVAEREFRSDLYYRLKVFPIVVPPLRERPEDVPLLVEHFTARHARRCNKSLTRIPSETLTALCNYDWPGNVREMENLIERSVILSQGPTLEVPLGDLKPANGVVAGEMTLVDIERAAILRALTESNWVISGPSGAARKLGMKRTSLQYKMKKLGISRPA